MGPFQALEQIAAVQLVMVKVSYCCCRKLAPTSSSVPHSVRYSLVTGEWRRTSAMRWP
ncbi:hypothetical protein QBC99_005291 [Beijerinckia sp. GAS462]|nr:hypothetical protein [Beijerinckia sp. GAS462]SED92578.1 hypothetical protein SAMN05443249_5935 [Beijerinckia sp. 28-YEA-48]